MKINKILILGNGWIGNLLKEYFESQNILTYICNDRFGWHSLEDVEARIKHFDPDVVINTIAKTDIDWCEKNKFDSFVSNVLVADYVATACARQHKKLVFFSSGCVFESKLNNDWYYEEDSPSPKCFYTECKVMAEKLVMEECPDAIILRPRLPVSEKPHPRNAIDKLSKYVNLNHNKESITVLEDMFPVLLQILKEDQSGIFHMVNKGFISPKEIGEIFGFTFKVWDKGFQDNVFKEAGRAKRVTTLLGTHRATGLLPEIHSRMLSLKRIYESNKSNG